jgi:phosphatidate cytidylyltransferase
LEQASPTSPQLTNPPNPLTHHSGHIYICGLVAVLECFLFRELVKVRYNSHLSKIEKQIPLFKTTQWCWFAVAIFYTYGEFVAEIIKSNPRLHYLGVEFFFVECQTLVAFFIYAATFVLTVITMQKDLIRFQLNQLCWTLCILFLTVGQLKYIMHNVFNGLFWFTFPVLLVVINDIMAYVCGMSFGKKFVRRPFLALSPNKTWEGFIGGGICTVILGWFLAKYLAQFSWMTCPVDFPEFFPSSLECAEDPLFQKSITVIPEQFLGFVPNRLIRSLPGITEFCKNAKSKQPIECGAVGWSHDHFELNIHVLPIQLHSITLAIFASIVAPFGGFLASGIKRAYGIKDFDSLIPGHGGIMDRMDCQFLMSLCAWVHYNTFVKMATVSTAKILYMYKMLPSEDQTEFFKQLQDLRG